MPENCQDSALSPAAANDITIGGRILLNRQSSRSATRRHGVKVSALQNRAPEIADAVKVIRITAPGSLRLLRECHFFDAVNPIKALPENSYFAQLYQKISELRQDIAPGRKLIIDIFSFDRLFRPLRFDRYDFKTRAPDETDFSIFDDFLGFCFGNGAGDIEFNVLHSGPPEHIHGLQSRLGQSSKGGRPKRNPQPIGQKQAKEIAVKLADCVSMFAPQIKAQLLDRYGYTASLPTVQRWLRKAGVSKPVGRPRQERRRKNESLLTVSASAAPSETLENTAST